MLHLPTPANILNLLFCDNRCPISKMYRTALFRTTRILAKRNTLPLVASRPPAVHFIRPNSTRVLPETQPPLTEEQKKKEALKRNDALQRDWDAVVLSYEALLPKTESPTPVRGTTLTVLFDIQPVFSYRIRSLSMCGSRTRSYRGWFLQL